MTSIKERLIQIADYYGISKREFCRKIDVSQAFLAKEGDISSNVLTKIVNTYTDIRIMWLLTGEGEMLRNHDKPEPTTSQPESPSQVERLMEMNMRLMEMNGKLTEANIQNAGSIDRLTKIIDFLQRGRSAGEDAAGCADAG